MENSNFLVKRSSKILLIVSQITIPKEPDLLSTNLIPLIIQHLCAESLFDRFFRLTLQTS